MSTRQDRSRKVCWSIVVPDRWHPKINTTRRSSGRARTIERAERLANARVLRLNRGSSSRSLWRDGSSLGDSVGHHFGLPPLMPFLHAVSRERTRAPDRERRARWQLPTYRLHDDPAVWRGASAGHADRGSHPDDPPGSGSAGGSRWKTRITAGSKTTASHQAAMAHPMQRPVMPQ